MSSHCFRIQNGLDSPFPPGYNVTVDVFHLLLLLATTEGGHGHLVSFPILRWMGLFTIKYKLLDCFLEREDSLFVYPFSMRQTTETLYHYILYHQHAE